MHRVVVFLSLLFALPSYAQSQPLALESVRIHEAYSDHPLVLAVRSQGYLAILDREKVLDKRFPTDRAWAPSSGELATTSSSAGKILQSEVSHGLLLKHRGRFFGIVGSQLCHIDFGSAPRTATRRTWLASGSYRGA